MLTMHQCDSVHAWIEVCMTLCIQGMQELHAVESEAVQHVGCMHASNA